eukprot:2751031-Pleurochrysis_carterae.AAC.2
MTTRFAEFAYAQLARERCAELGLDSIKFVNGNAFDLAVRLSRHEKSVKRRVQPVFAKTEHFGQTLS